MIHFASALAETITNSQGSGFSISSGDHQDEAFDKAKMCNGTFGSDSITGFAGKVQFEPRTGTGLNAHGLNATNFMLPGLWDPNKGDCWTTM